MKKQHLFFTLLIIPSLNAMEKRYRAWAVEAQTELEAIFQQSMPTTRQVEEVWTACIERRHQQKQDNQELQQRLNRLQQRRKQAIARATPTANQMPASAKVHQVGVD